MLFATTAAQFVASWVSTGDRNATIYITDASITLLPALPADLLRVECLGCRALRFIPSLPDGLTHLYCWGCPALCSLPPLPAGLTYLSCWGGCDALRFLPPLPAGLMHLSCSTAAVLPNSCPVRVCLNGATPAASRAAWQRTVAVQHARDRGATAVTLPAAALLYV